MKTSRIAVVSGSARGLGLCLVNHLLANSFTVIAHVRSESSCRQLLTTVSGRSVGVGNLVVLPAELNDKSQVESFCLEVARRAPKIDLLINNAGVFSHERDRSLEQLSLEFLWEATQVNFLAAATITYLLTNVLAASPRSVVVNVLTDLIRETTFDGAFPAYRASKAALAMMTSNQGRGQQKFVTIGFDPGWMRTDMGGPQAPDDPDEMARRLIHLVGEPDLLESGRIYCGSEILLPAQKQ